VFTIGVGETGDVLAPEAAVSDTLARIVRAAASDRPMSRALMAGFVDRAVWSLALAPIHGPAGATERRVALVTVLRA
jgi:hypothetical protein